MASDVQQLRSLIEHRLRDSGRASLVEVLAEFDCFNHALPSAWKWSRALEQLTIAATWSADPLWLELASAPADPLVLSESALATIVESYRRSVGSRSASPGA
jgi:hypothetical protein